MTWNPHATRNGKCALNVAHKGNQFSVTYFQERMNNAFRDISYYRTLAYKKYDTSSINSSELTGPPALEGLAYAEDTLINAYKMAETVHVYVSKVWSSLSRPSASSN